MPAKWSVLNSGPPPRHGHSATALHRRLYIFGGKGARVSEVDGEYLNDMHVLDPETWAWKEIAGRSRVIPPARAFHSASAIDDRIIIFGGACAEGTTDDFNCRNDVWSFKLDVREWVQITMAGEPPAPRAAHTAASVSAGGGQQVIVFGGTDGDGVFDDVHLMQVTSR